jgi:uncharacterized membrane protein YgaE (UPF0421/DUF939 family)
LTLPLLEELIKLYPKFRHQYERQLFVISISELLQNETLPENLRGVLVKLIETLINIQQQLSEQIELERVKKEEDSSDSDQDEEMSDDD